MLSLDGFAKKMPTDIANQMYKKTKSVKHKGDHEKFRTPLGVFLSLIVYAGLIGFAYFAYQMLDELKDDLLDEIDLDDLGLGDLEQQLSTEFSSSLFSEDSTASSLDNQNNSTSS